MTCIAFVGGTVILPDRVVDGVGVVCRDGVITSVGKAKPPSGAQIIDLRGAYLSPGFVDIHVHGGNGADFMDATLNAVTTACIAHAKHGTTTIFPTTTTGSPDQILAMLDACGQYLQQPTGPNLEGVHLYGPYFAETKLGCHSSQGRRNPTKADYDRYFATGLIRIATCAAELPGAKEFYQTARRHNCLITCGHSNSTWAEMQAAFKVGMRHVDHFWCAMSSITSLRSRFKAPMQASMAEFVLIQDEMSTEVLADGWHLAPELLDFAYRMKGAKRLCIVTDCNRALDLPPGKYPFGNAADDSWFESDGKVGWTIDGNSLASSVVGMDHMVRQMKKATSASLPEVIRMASLTPAERTGVSDVTGSIERGKRADLLVLTRQLRVKQVYIRGQELVA
jgi:N-acetylglucosamine-6-phosphate deacetylase